MMKIVPICAAAVLSLTFASGAFAQTKPAGNAGTNKQMTFEEMNAMSETDQMAAMKMMNDNDKMMMKKSCPGDAGTKVGMNKTMTEFCKM